MKKISVLISGQGSTLAAIIEAIERQELPAVINRVIADRPCPGLRHAETHALPQALVDRKLPVAEQAQALLCSIPDDTDLIVLAGYLSRIPDALIDAFPKKIINIHPSLLPRHGGPGMYGIRVHRAVLAAGDSISGCSVHYVDHGEIDSGQIIAQSRLEVAPDDTPETLQHRVQALERPLLFSCIRQLLK